MKTDKGMVKHTNAVRRGPRDSLEDCVYDSMEILDVTIISHYS